MIAFAVNYDSAGEKLTHKVAGDRYLALPLHWDPKQSARLLYHTLKSRAKQDPRYQFPRINIAGNSLYTLSHSAWDQKAVDSHIYQVLALCHAHYPIQSVRSGGQTGADEAGIVAALALKIPAIAYFPAGYKQRNAHGQDMSADPVLLEQQWRERALGLIHNPEGVHYDAV